MEDWLLQQLPLRYHCEKDWRPDLMALKKESLR